MLNSFEKYLVFWETVSTGHIFLCEYYISLIKSVTMETAHIEVCELSRLILKGMLLLIFSPKLMFNYVSRESTTN